jgi:formylglycine-generating enzyme required for sulfatase activity
MKLKLIPAGSFKMGSPDSDIDADPDERPQHSVQITKPFYLGVHEVTRGQFRRFVDATGYRTDAETDGKGGQGWNGNDNFEQAPTYTWLNPGFQQTDEHPVVLVSWNDAVAFCAWLSRNESKTYRLPTEAEWEYACRAGTTTKYFCGDDPEGLAAVANVADGTAREVFPAWRPTIAARDGFIHTAPVGQFHPNAFGLYDMHGNAHEWCRDSYEGRYYRRSPRIDPSGPSQGAMRVFRGGGWVDAPGVFCSAERHGNPPSYRIAHLGFRVAVELKPATRD